MSSKMSLACSELEKQRRSMMFSPSVVMYLIVAWWFNEILCAFQMGGRPVFAIL